MAPLQKRALFGLIAGLAVTVAFVIALVVQGDPTAFDRDSGVRIVMYAALIGVPLIYLILINLTLIKPTQIDERDKLIMERSGKVQWLAVILSLVVWTISLTEIYHDAGQVPVAFLYLIFVSTLIVGTLSQSLGILLGYWRMDRDG